MSKILLKVAGVGSIIFACLYLFIFIMIHLFVPYNYLANSMFEYIAVIVLAIFSLISMFGGILFNHYSNLSDEELNNKKDAILGWSIVLFVTCVICGVIGLISYMVISLNNGFKHKNNYIEEIKSLEKLKEQGLITEEEYKAKKKQILNI